MKFHIFQVFVDVWHLIDQLCVLINICFKDDTLFSYFSAWSITMWHVVVQKLDIGECYSPQYGYGAITVVNLVVCFTDFEWPCFNFFHSGYSKLFECFYSGGIFFQFSLFIIWNKTNSIHNILSCLFLKQSFILVYRLDPDNSKWFVTKLFVRFKWNFWFKVNALIQILAENAN